MTTPPSGMRPLSIEDKVLKTRPNKTRLLTALMALNKVAVDDYKFRINEQKIDPGYITCTALNAGANQITVSAADAAYIRLGTTLRLDHQNAYLVTAVNYSTGVITLNGTTNLTNSSVLNIGGTGSEELSLRPAAISRIPVQIENFVETQRDAWGTSRHTQNVRYYGGSRVWQTEDDATWEHKRSIDRGCWFNVKAETTQDSGNGSQVLLKTNGILSLITTNVYTFGSNLVSMDKIRTNLRIGTRFTMSDRLWLCFGAKGQELLDKICYDKTVPQQFNTTALFDVTTYTIGGKKLVPMIIDHFDNGMDDTWVVLDPEFLEIVTTQDQQSNQRQWMLKRTIKPQDNTNGVDGTINDILTDYGVRLHNEMAHSIWDGAQAVGS